MSPLGGLMKVGLGVLLAWAFLSGTLSRYTDRLTAAVTGSVSAAPAPAAAAAAGGAA